MKYLFGPGPCTSVCLQSYLFAGFITRNTPVAWGIIQTDQKVPVTIFVKDMAEDFFLSLVSGYFCVFLWSCPIYKSLPLWGMAVCSFQEWMNYKVERGFAVLFECFLAQWEGPTVIIWPNIVFCGRDVPIWTVPQIPVLVGKEKLAFISVCCWLLN